MKAIAGIVKSEIEKTIKVKDFPNNSVIGLSL